MNYNNFWQKYVKTSTAQFVFCCLLEGVKRCWEHSPHIGNNIQKSRVKSIVNIKTDKKKRR